MATYAMPLSRTIAIDSMAVPDGLPEMIEALSYKDGWSFAMVGDRTVMFGNDATGLYPMLEITISTIDSVTRMPITVEHRVTIPPYLLDPEWSGLASEKRRWLLDQVFLVERHESMEFFKIAGVAMFFPEHALVKDPYQVVDRSTDVTPPR